MASNHTMPIVGASQSFNPMEGSSGILDIMGAHPVNMSMGHSEPEGSTKADHDISSANESRLKTENESSDRHDELLQKMLGYDSFDQRGLCKFKQLIKMHERAGAIKISDDSCLNDDLQIEDTEPAQ